MCLWRRKGVKRKKPKIEVTVFCFLLQNTNEGILTPYNVTTFLNCSGTVPSLSPVTVQKH